MNRWCFAVFLASALGSSVASAHGSSLAVFKVAEQEANTYSVLWKVNQAAASAKLEDIRFASGCAITGEPEKYALEGTTRTMGVLGCASGPGLGEVVFPDNPPGLHVMVEASFLGGERVTTLLREERAAHLTPAMEQSAWSQALRYCVIGVEHILLGPDHLLFVLGLLLLVNSGRGLIAAITAFTVAHSVTLALAVLGLISLKPAPMEACIALSIVMLAREVLTDSETFSKRFPWMVAFGFGLLHGLGFAGALSEIGLPQDILPLALVSFNVGVELGQLLFVWGIWQCGKMARQQGVEWGRLFRICTAYGMGSVAVYWVFDRMAWAL
jgi:hydrogenase/urease accessory protein HupE